MWECSTLGVPGGDCSQVLSEVVNSLASLLEDKMDRFFAASVWEPASCVLLLLGYPYHGAGRASRRWSRDIDGILLWDVRVAAEPTDGVLPL